MPDVPDINLTAYAIEGLIPVRPSPPSPQSPSPCSPSPERSALSWRAKEASAGWPG